MDISRIELFCDEKNVGKICRLLLGLAIDIPRVIPVINAKYAGKKLEPVTNGKLLALFVDWIKKNKVGELTHRDLRDFVRREAGRPESAYVSLRKAAQGAGILKKQGAGKNCKYIVIKARGK